jgi:hypothetical protein
MAQIDKKPGERVVPEAGSLPIIFNFRPTSIEFVGPERRQAWIDYMRKEVGFPVEDYRWSGDPRETISGSGDGWDDCDYW